MNIIDQSVESVLIEDAMERIEFAGRVCYNSTDRIKKGETALPFVKGLIRAGHGTPLEAARVGIVAPQLLEFVRKYKGDEAARVADTVIQDFRVNRNHRVYFVCDDALSITVRDYLMEGFPLEFLEDPENYCMDPAFATVVIVTDRGIANECVRHRVMHYDDDGYPVGWNDPPAGNSDDMSMVQASTRYINYGKKPFSVVRPSPAPWSTKEGSKEYQLWYSSCKQSFDTYKNMLEAGVPQQFARNVLPLSTATTVVMSGTGSQWTDFLKLRLDTAAHPQMIVLANLILRSEAVKQAIVDWVYADLLEFAKPGIEKVNKIQEGLL